MSACPPALVCASDAVVTAVDALPGDLRYAQLRLEITRLARRVVGPEHADELVQRVFRHAVRTGPRTPRDHRGMPRPAYLAALVHSFAGQASGSSVEFGSSLAGLDGVGARGG